MNDNQYAQIKTKAAQLMPAAATGLGMGGAGLQFRVNEMEQSPRLDTAELPPTVWLNKADYRDLILRLRDEP